MSRERTLAATLWLAAFAMLLAGTPALSWAVSPPWEIEALPSTPAPAFSLPDMEGKVLSLSEFKGQVLLINFWATWCGPCREEMPTLDALQQKFKGKGLTVIGIDIDADKALVRKFLDTTPLRFPILHDPKMISHDAYKVYSYPTTFLVDRKGIIQKYWLGPQEWNSDNFTETLQGFLH